MDAPPKTALLHPLPRDPDPSTSRTLLSTSGHTPPEPAESDVYGRTVITHGNVTASLPSETVIADATTRYEPGPLLGAGGMGEVRLVKDSRIGRAVARKTLHPAAAAGGGDAWKRFVREARVQGQLEHPSVVPVYDFGTTETGDLCFTMRRVAGVTVEKVLDALAAGDPEATAKYSRRKLLTAFVSACLAVHYAHTRGVVHRDLKPANLMLGEFGEVYVLDWGVAKLASGAQVAVEPSASRSPDDETEAGALIGTPAYMSPEQLLGKTDQIDARSDVYALGLILYELLTHARFHAGRGFAAIASATLEGVTVRPSALRGDVPPELDAACLRATAREQDQRFKSVRELADAVERYLDGDRDLERRRELAASHATSASEARARGEAGREEAMREVMAALALDPAQPDARRLLVELLVQQPDELPRGAAEALAEQDLATRREGMKQAVLGLLSFCACIPYTLILLGVKSWAVMGTGSILLLLSTALAAILWRRPRIPSAGLGVLVVLVGISISVFSAWMGPFILLPSAAVAVAGMAAAHCERRERWVVLVVSVLAVVTPWALEVAGVVPRSMAFSGDTLTLFARGVHFPPALTSGALVYSAIAGVVLIIFLLGRMRDALRAAERKLFLQAWHLRRLAEG